MDLNHLCMGCMENKGEEELCPKCGWMDGSLPDSPLHMPSRTLLHEKYLLGRVLGQGGFGITYLAWDIYLDRKLAIKEYFPRELVYRESGKSSVSVYTGTQSDQYKYGLSKFLAEAINLARFEGHPNIVAVRDYFETNTTAYMVMNFLEGVTLSDYLNRVETILTFNETLKIIMPVLDALRTVHEGGLLHRDISPDNIIITTKKRVMLLDFGAARHALGEKGKKFSVIVKAGYAPEEQYRSNGSQGPWTDIYAVAATIYRAITGLMPPDSLDRLSSDTLIPPSQLGVHIDVAGESALLKALAVSSDERFQSVAEFQQSLWSALHDVSSTGSGEVIDPPLTANAKTYLEPGHWVETDSIVPVESISSQTSPERIVSPVGTVNIGRANDNDFVLTDSMVSRHHAAINYQSGRWFITDLNSTHGTIINGRPVRDTAELPPDTCLQLGQVTLYFKDDALLSETGDLLMNLLQSLQGPDNLSAAGCTDHNIDRPAASTSSRIIILMVVSALLGISLLVYSMVSL